MRKTKIGIVGCGNISSIYLQNLNQRFETVEVAAVADLIEERSQSQAEKYGVAKVLETEQLLNDPEIEIVLNLTTPAGHAEICRRALEAGKHVYVEKPLSVSLADGAELKKLAAGKGLLLGGAPDTFMGAGIQTCLDIIKEGKIGRPIGATAFMVNHGHESWHPDPEFYYKVGGGPMFDMGPYYLTALFALMGPAARVTGSTAISFEQRTITSEEKNGTIIDVEIPTHVAGVIDFRAGGIATILTSFDIWQSNLPRIEIYGSEGTLSVPDPNTFEGPVRIGLSGKDAFEEIEITRPYSENSRGLGVADMARALRENKKDHRASGDMTFHVLEAMHGFHLASENNSHHMMESTFAPPASVDPDYRY